MDYNEILTAEFYICYRQTILLFIQRKITGVFMEFNFT